MTSIMLIFLILFVIMIISFGLTKVRAVQLFADNEANIFPPEPRLFRLTPRELLKHHLNATNNSTLMKVNGACLEQCNIEPSDLLSVARLQDPEWEINGDQLYLNGVLIDVRNTFLIFNYSQSKHKNASENFKIRRLDDFQEVNGRLIIKSSKFDMATKEWSMAEHDISFVMGILEKNLTKNRDYYQSA